MSFFPGSLVSFFSGHWCLFASFAATVSSESPCKLFLFCSQPWAVGLGSFLLGLRPGWAPVFFDSGFGLGLLHFRLRPGFTPLGFRAPFAPLRDRAFLLLMFRSGYTLFSLLLCSFIRVRSRFTPFRASAFGFSPFRVSSGFTPFKASAWLAVLLCSFILVSVCLLRLRPGCSRGWRIKNN